LSKLPSLSWKGVERGLKKTGFVFDRQKGSHRVYYHPETNVTVVVPQHSEIKKGTLMQILRQAGLRREEFLKLL
jgi:predicted RNA binding protein YcfA (HicA-like mRNA interferase family)